nr:G protein-coupled receptor [Proales similis]
MLIFIILFLALSGNLSHRKTCPLIFDYSRVEQIEFRGMTRSMIAVNELTFRSKTIDGQPQVINYAWDDDLFYLYLNEVYRPYLSREFFSERMFNFNLMSIYISGILGEIQPSIFQELYAKLIFLRLWNFRKFFELNQKFLFELDISFRITFKQANELEENNIYPLRNKQTSWFQYEDEAFCLFKYFPIYNDFNNIFYILNDFELNLTCTIVWIMTNSVNNSEMLDRFASFERLELRDFIQSNPRVELLAQKFLLAGNFTSWSENNCNFTRMQELCDIENPPKSKNYETYEYDAILRLEMAKFILVIIFQPIFAILGLITNFTIIKTNETLISSNKGSREGSGKILLYKNNLLIYIKYNACYTFFFCLAVLPKVLTDCVKYNGIYCSPFLGRKPIQYLNVLITIYAANVLKMCSSLTQCTYTLYRYFMNKTAQENHTFASQFLKYSTIKLNFIILITSLLLNSVFIFLNQNYSLMDIQLTSGYDILMFDLVQINSKSLRTFATVLYGFDIILNDVFLILFNVYVDIKLYRFIRNSLEKRKSTLPDAQIKNGKNNQSLQKRENTKNNMTRIIMINGILGGLLKIPHLLASAYVYYDFVYRRNSSQQLSSNIIGLGRVCFYMGARFDSACLNFYEITESMATLTHSINFFLLYKFNEQFRKAFTAYLERAKNLILKPKTCLRPV